MPDTYSKIYIHIIFSVKERQPLVLKSFRSELFSYIGGIIKNKDQKPIIINGTADHIHILAGIKPDKSISDLVREIKSNSSKFINEKKYLQSKFQWQEGFAAFSYSESQVNKVAEYIKNQEEHHKKKTFSEEYLDFLKKFNVEYNEAYVL
jgi:REP element-mobilizing transposase RayT